MTEQQREEAETASRGNQEYSEILQAFQAVRENSFPHDEVMKYAYLVNIHDYNRLNAAADKFRNMIIRRKVKLPPNDFGHIANLALRTHTSRQLEETLARLGTWGSCDHVAVFTGPADDYFDFTIFGPPIDGKLNRILVGGVKYYPVGREWEIHT